MSDILKKTWKLNTTKIFVWERMLKPFSIFCDRSQLNFSASSSDIVFILYWEKNQSRIKFIEVILFIKVWIINNKENNFINSTFSQQKCKWRPKDLINNPKNDLKVFKFSKLITGNYLHYNYETLIKLCEKALKSESSCRRSLSYNRKHKEKSCRTISVICKI